MNINLPCVSFQWLSTVFSSIIINKPLDIIKKTEQLYKYENLVFQKIKIEDVSIGLRQIGKGKSLTQNINAEIFGVDMSNIIQIENFKS